MDISTLQPFVFQELCSPSCHQQNAFYTVKSLKTDIPCFLLMLHVYFSTIKTFHYYYYYCSYRDSGTSKKRVKKSLFCQSRTLLLSRSIYDFIIRLSAAATSTEYSVSVCRARRCTIYRSFERCNDFIIDRPHRVPRDAEERKDRVVPREKNTQACIFSSD